MASQHLSNRTNWQAHANLVGSKGETEFATALSKSLTSDYTVELKPAKLLVYGSRGVVLDVKVTNNNTGKSLFIEKKTGNNGGNAHERVYKFLSPALKRYVSEKYNTPSNPFYLVFSGDTFQGEKYQNEFKLLLEDENYSIMKPNFSNIDEVANNVMEII
jgi:hypothetical protein